MSPADHSLSPPQKRRCPGYDSKLHLVVIFHFWEVWSIPVRVPSICQIDLFKNYLYPIGLFTKKIPLKKQLQRRSIWTYNEFYNFQNPVGWGWGWSCRIRRLHLCRELKKKLPATTNRCPDYEDAFRSGQTNDNTIMTMTQFLEKYTSHFIWKGLCERELETE